MNNVKTALMRKIGPFPAWVYAIIFGVAVYWYRNRGANKPQTVLDPATQPGVMDSQTPQDIVPLQPGESAYNPNTGQLVSTAPEQFPPNPQPDRPLPITLEPGETVYDPETHQLLGGTTPAAATTKTTPKHKAKPRFSLRKGVTLDKGYKLVKGAHAHLHGKAGTLGPTGGFHPLAKRKAKAKAKPKAPPRTTPHTKSKARSAAHLPATPTPRAPGRPVPAGRTRTPAPAAHAPAGKRVVATTKPQPAATQHVAPARAAPAAHRAAPPPPPARRPAPPPPARKRR